MLYAQLDSFTFFMKTLLAKMVTEGIGYGHYTSSMIASEVALKTSSKKSKIKLIPQSLKVNMFKCNIPFTSFQKSHLTYIMAIPSVNLYKNMPYFETVSKTFSTFLGQIKDGIQKLGL